MPLAIRNYGHFWNRELVEWGNRGRGNQGNIQGYVMRDRQPLITDFREQIGIYVLYAQDREVVYVGQTGAGDRRLFLRLRDHTRDHLRDRWTNFSWFGFRKVNLNGELSDRQHPDARVQGNANDALDEVEATLLQLFEPRLNKQGPRWRGSTEYLQYVASEHEPQEADDPNAELNQKLDRITEAMDL